MYGRRKKPRKLKIQKQFEDNTFKNTRNVFNLKKGNKVIKYRIVRDINTLFEQQEEDFYKPVRVVTFWNNNYMEYESSGDRNKNLSVKEYFNEIKPYLKI